MFGRVSPDERKDNVGRLTKALVSSTSTADKKTDRRAQKHYAAILERCLFGRYCPAAPDTYMDAIASWHHVLCEWGHLLVPDVPNGSDGAGRSDATHGNGDAKGRGSNKSASMAKDFWHPRHLIDLDELDLSRRLRKLESVKGSAPGDTSSPPGTNQSSQCTISSASTTPSTASIATTASTVVIPTFTTAHELESVPGPRLPSGHSWKLQLVDDAYLEIDEHELLLDADRPPGRVQDWSCLEEQQVSDQHTNRALGLEQREQIAMCRKCAPRKTNVSMYQIQTRSADEPMTVKYQCECGNNWKE